MASPIIDSDDMESRSGFVVPLWIDGREVFTQETFDVISPVDGKVSWRASSANESDVMAAVEAASTAFLSWSKTKPAERRSVFLRAHALLIEKRDLAKKYSYVETASSETQFAFEYNAGMELCLQLANLPAAMTGTVPETNEAGSRAMIIREPYGVVLGIAPWNAPHVLGLRACLAPLAVGNTVILKGPELAPATYWNFVSILHEAGLPRGCLNTIYHAPQSAASITQLLISHPAIKKVNFTGSTKVGSIVARLAGQNLKPCLLELGGKAPAIVCEDADLSLTAQQCVLGAFIHSGQICMSTERIIVHSKILADFKQALKAAFEEIISQGKPTVLITEVAAKRNKELLEDAVSKGARAVCGDLATPFGASNTLHPVILENVTKEMNLFYSESFGPSVAIFPVKSDEEALALANDTEYGLSSAIFTEDLRRGMQLARGIETGSVHINGMTIHDEPWLPHGGAKRSGFGRNNAIEGLQEWTRTKVITWKD
ncbi:hypothetical protein LTR84_004502 [Exophiala bonariae]|uniref:Aldehyde dehydrogenase domain-containing protein n=1 Tax=Exophiala bonariae TaxID=1690606 RepID=A0AAV9N589_9EURO|nr:hypothetical protein LTR84_004502 [Exophiala bonariae]